MMRFASILSFALLGSTAAGLIKRQYDSDFSGAGNIFVVNGKDIQNADPTHIAGCITNAGRFVTDTTKCGIFSRRDNQPFSSLAGPCSFTDSTAEIGRPMAPQGYAFKCSAKTEPISVFYSLQGLDAGDGQAWVWQGNLNPYFEAMSVPAAGVEAPIWYYTGGIDPPTDRVYLMWLWKKLSV